MHPINHYEESFPGPYKNYVITEIEHNLFLKTLLERFCNVKGFIGIGTYSDSVNYYYAVFDRERLYNDNLYGVRPEQHGPFILIYVGAYNLDEYLC